MYWLDEHIELDNYSTLWAIVIFSILSIICSIFTIVIYLRMKNLRTLVYRFFFHVAINEIISRILSIITIIANYYKQQITFLLFSSLIYLTDTNIIILTTFTCLGMFLLIIKQNNKLAEQFNKISFILYGTSLVFSLTFCLSFFAFESKEKAKKIMYLNIIALQFITDDKDNNFPSVLYSQIIYLLLLILSFVCIFLIQAFVKDRANIPSNMENEEEAMKDKTIKSSLKLKTFKIKLLAYPFLNFAYIIPLTIYLWIEYAYLAKKKKEEELDEKHVEDRDYDVRTDMTLLRVRYTFYNIYCFMNSIRGFVYFRVFIDNETIKMYLFKKYLHFDLFKTIDQIQEEEELSNGKSSKVIERDNITPIEKEINKNFGTNFDINNKNKNNLINSEDKNTSEGNKRDSTLIEMDSKSKQALAKAGLINDEEDSDDSEDSDDEEKKMSRVSKPEVDNIRNKNN